MRCRRVGDRPLGGLPRHLADSDELRVCDRFGYTAMQFKDEVELASLNEQSEDCLTLNIWRPEGAATDLPSWSTSMAVRTSVAVAPTAV